MKLFRVYILDINNEEYSCIQEKHKVAGINDFKFANTVTEKSSENQTLFLFKEGLKCKVRNKIILVDKNTLRDMDMACRVVFDLLSLNEKRDIGVTIGHPGFCMVNENYDELKLFQENEIEILEHDSSIKTNNYDFSIEHFDRLSDRLDAFSLFRKAYFSKDFVQKLRDYFLIYENAFGQYNKAIIDPLINFLQQFPEFGYTRLELNKIVNFRHNNSHGHKKITKFSKMLVERVNRMEQACYLLLFNKKAWMSKDKELYNKKILPTTGTSNDSHSLFLTQGREANFELYFQDPQLIFPKSMSGFKGGSGKGSIGVNPDGSIQTLFYSSFDIHDYNKQRKII